MALEVYFRLTNNCNLECGHCCYDSKPGGETISEKDLEIALGNIPYNVRGIIFSGGEVFTRKKRLWQALEYVSDNRDEKFPLLDGVTVQTNGFWINNSIQTKETLQKMADYGVSGVQVASYDFFHQFKKIPHEVFQFSPGLIRSHGLEFYMSGNDSPVPFGRAKDLSEEKLTTKAYCFASLNRVTISPDGNVSFCCFSGSPTMGSIIEDPLDEIISRARRNTLHRKLIRHRLDLVAKKLGKDPMVPKSMACYFCSDLFDGVDMSKYNSAGLFGIVSGLLGNIKH
jgi:hypothetical protein